MWSPGEGSLPLCVLTQQEREQDVGVCPQKDTNPVMQAAPSGPHLNLINSASGPSSIYHHTGARASTWIFCRLVAQSCLTLCNPMDCSTPGLPVPHHLPDFAQAHAHCISDAVQPSHLLTPSSPSALSLSQHQGLFHWVICLHQMTKILELQLQHQSFQRILRVDLPWGWLVWSPCCPRDFQESSPAPQLEDINALVFYLYSPALTTVRDHWEDHSL